MKKEKSLYFDQEYDDFYLQQTSIPYKEAGYHFHDTYELWYLFADKASAFIKDQSYSLTAGDLLIINKDIIHRLQVSISDQVATRNVIEFKKEFLDKSINAETSENLLSCFQKNINFYRPTFNEKNFLENTFHKMILEQNKKEKNHRTYLRILLVEILLFLNRITDKASSQIIEYPDETHELISNITKYINKNYQQNINLKLLADNFSISRFYLCRIFKEITGFTFTEYLNNVRIKQSHEILKNTDIKVTQIAGKVGYNTISQFYRMFKKITKTTPMEYRKINRNK